MFLKKKKKQTAEYDRTRLYPAVKSSICTGEQVAGFAHRETGKFEDIMLIRSGEDLQEFCRMYGIREDEVKKIW